MQRNFLSQTPEVQNIYEEFRCKSL